MKSKPDTYFFLAGLFLPTLFIGTFVLLAVFWTKAPDMEIVVEFWTILSAVTLMGLIPWICFWRLWFSFFEIDQEGMKQCCILCKTTVIRWTDCTDCGICRVQNGMAGWRYYIYASTVSLTEAQKLGLVTMKKGPMIWGRTALRVAYSDESSNAVCKYAPASLIDMLESAPMFPASRN